MSSGPPGSPPKSSQTAAGYQVKPDTYFGHAREEILPLLPGTVARIADIGGGTGATLSLIKQHHPNAVTLCVDRQESALALAAKSGHLAIACDLDYAVPPEIAACDVVLCLDILEHLVDPWAVLGKIHSCMRPGAAIIVSIPNVRYWPVSSGLLLGGRWDLQPEGVLDSTHLRFFTKKSGVSLLRNAGFRLMRIEGKLGPSWRGAAANAMTFGMFRDLFVIQYLLVGTR